MRIQLPTILLLIVGLIASLTFLLEAREEIDQLERHNLQYQAALEEGLYQTSDSTWSSVALPSDTDRTTVTTHPDTVIKRDTVFYADTLTADTLTAENRVAQCTSVLTTHQTRISRRLRLTLRPITIRARDRRAEGVLRTHITSPIPVDSVLSTRSISPTDDDASWAITLTLGQDIQSVGYTHRVWRSISVGGAVYHVGGSVAPGIRLRYTP